MGGATGESNGFRLKEQAGRFEGFEANTQVRGVFSEAKKDKPDWASPPRT